MQPNRKLLYRRLKNQLLANKLWPTPNKADHQLFIHTTWMRGKGGKAQPIIKKKNGLSNITKLFNNKKKYTDLLVCFLRWSWSSRPQLHKPAQPPKRLDCTHEPPCPAVILTHGTVIHHKNLAKEHKDNIHKMGFADHVVILCSAFDGLFPKQL